MLSTPANKAELLAWTPQMVKTFWDYWSNSPDIFFACRYGWEVTRQISPYLPKEGAILDYGCGPGCLARELLERDLQVAGLDFSPEMVGLVNRRFGARANFLGAFQADAMTDKAHSFDAAVAIEVIEHLYDEQLNELLDNLQMLLRPGGLIVLTTPNEENLEDNYVLCPVSGQLFHRWQHVRSWSVASLSDYLRDRGFELEAAFTTDFTATFHTMESRRPLRDKFKALKKRLKYRVKPGKKRPHLVAVARTPR